MKVLDYNGLKTFATKIKSLLAGKQDKLTAGTNVTISGNRISATDTKYTAGENITIDLDNKISVDSVKVAERVEVPLTNTGAGFWYKQGNLICRKYSNGLVSLELVTGVAELGISKPLEGTLPIGFRPKHFKTILAFSIGKSLELTESNYGIIDAKGKVSLNPAMENGKDFLMPEFFYHPEA